MSLLLAAAAVTAATMVPACSWNAPGRHPYRGTAGEAVSRYVDIPAATRTRLVARIAAGQADDVIITRDAVTGRRGYEAAITEMHFGRQTVCGRVTRERWPLTAREPAKVYCADGHCLIVPRVCGNISRIRPLGAGAGGNAGAAGPGAAGPGAGAGLPFRPGKIPEPAGAPEIDIELTDAMARLSAPRSAAAPAPLPGHPLGDWGPGPRLSPAPQPALAVPALPVPEPAGWVMFLVGALGVLVYSRYRK